MEDKEPHVSVDRLNFDKHTVALEYTNGEKPLGRLGKALTVAFGVMFFTTIVVAWAGFMMYLVTGHFWYWR